MKTNGKSVHLSAELRQRLTGVEVLSDGPSLASYGHDWWPLDALLREIGGQAPLLTPTCAVRPATTEDVAQILKLSNELGFSVVPYGGGSGVCAGAKPSVGSVVLDLRKLNRVLQVDQGNLLARVEAGVVLSDLEAELDGQGLTTGHYPQSVDLATVGGLVATRSSGQFSTGYGSVEDVLARCQVVLPDGSTVWTGQTPRQAVGPDLRGLFVGSEGTIGIITCVDLKLRRKASHTEKAAYHFPSFDRGVEALREVMQSGLRPTAVRLYDELESASSFQSVAPQGSTILLVITEGPPTVCTATAGATDDTVKKMGGSELGIGPVDHWLKTRNDRTKFTGAIDQHLVIETIEVAGLWSCIGGMAREATSALRMSVPSVQSVACHLSHAYDQGASLYFTVRAGPFDNATEAIATGDAIWRTCLDAVQNEGGTVGHHHGVGKVRVPWEHDLFGSSLPLLRLLRKTLDPHHVMNPGTLFTMDDREDFTRVSDAVFRTGISEG